MKKLNKLFLLIFLANLWLWAQPLNAQNKYNLASEQNFKVSGTSTIHDWEMISTSTATGEATMTVETGKLKEIKSLKITIPVESLKSGKGQMDKNAYKALETEKNPNIIFELLQVQEITGDYVKAKGNMTVAGATRPVTLQVKYSISGNTIRFNGQHAIKFSEFNIDPPTAVFGTIKTGDDLQLQFDVNFNHKNLTF